MKKVMIASASLAIFAFGSCTDTPEPANEKETIIIEKEVPASREVPKDDNGTSISVDKDGVSFSKKDDNTKIDIDLKDKK